MLYYLISYLEEAFQPTGFQVIQFSTVRASLAAITALAISLFVGRSIINWLAKKQLGETVRCLEVAVVGEEVRGEHGWMIADDQV